MLLLPGRTFTQGFAQSLAALVRHFTLEGRPYGLRWEQGSDIYMLRNNLIAEGGNAGGAASIHPAIKACDYVVWIDSDMIFTPEDIVRLTSHGEDVVSGFAAIDMERTACGVFREDPPSLGYIATHGIEDVETDNRGLVPLDFAGMAIIAMRPRIFEHIEFPWFRTLSFELAGVHVHCSEDTGFCYRLKGAGIQVYGDPQVRVGHEKQMRLKV